ncbi:MAG: hypothetical protein SVM80_07210 [Halobacteriota archaeon]|nr:hypothetical protein [Halobacteriota archaeon]
MTPKEGVFSDKNNNNDYPEPFFDDYFDLSEDTEDTPEPSSPNGSHTLRNLTVIIIIVGGLLFFFPSLEWGEGDALEMFDDDFEMVDDDLIPQEEWNKTFGIPGITKVTINSVPKGYGSESIIQTYDGGIAVAGWTATSNTTSLRKGDSTLVNKFISDDDSWIIKLDKEGNNVWDKVYEDSNFNKAYSIIQTSDGGFAVAGEIAPSIMEEPSITKVDTPIEFKFITSQNHKGSSDFWIIKYDKDGNEVWEKTFSRSDNDGAHSIIQTSDGGYAVAGRTEPRKVWIIKLDNAGNKVWENIFGGGGGDNGKISITQTSDGGYAVADTIHSGEEGNYDARVVKLDRVGKVIWDKNFGGDTDDGAFSITYTSDNGCVVAGMTGSEGSNDAWIIKLDEGGNKVWDRIFGGNAHDEARSIVRTSDEGYAVAGRTFSKGAGESDAWVMRLNEDGKMVWDKTVGGYNLDYAYSIIQTSDEGYAVAGLSRSFKPKGVWVIKLEPDP